MKDDLKGVGVGSDDDQFGDASIECLGGLVGALLDLLQRGALGNQVEQLGGELLGCEGLGSFGDGLNSIGLTILLKKIIFAIIKIRQLIARLEGWERSAKRYVKVSFRWLFLTSNPKTP